MTLERFVQPTTSTEPMLNIEQLQVYYDDSRILSDVSLNVPHSKVVCLMGRNGVGKTTFMKSVMGLVKSRQGKILFDDEDITRYPAHKRAQAGIGYVPQ